jgi:hypothetical protein
MDSIQKSKYLMLNYGLTLEAYTALLESQGGKCAICNDPDPTHRLCVDHIHVKGFKKMVPEDKVKYVRGILCFMCNTALKGFDKTVSGKSNRNRLNGTCRYFDRYALKGEL